ncbi:hypothetical protein [Streptomyces sp. bgisy031]|uniref:hypothetical protein n=1 Tax=Streptomyces sp. bgisy031 TaxID=3413772 RepID=UPI003D7524BF
MGPRRWIPYEDPEPGTVRRSGIPTRVSPGRGRLSVVVRRRDPRHPLRLVTR